MDGRWGAHQQVGRGKRHRAEILAKQMGRKKLKRWLDRAIAKLMLARFLLAQRDKGDVDYETVARLIREVSHILEAG